MEELTEHMLRVIRAYNREVLRRRHTHRPDRQSRRVEQGSEETAFPAMGIPKILRTDHSDAWLAAAERVRQVLEGKSDPVKPVPRGGILNPEDESSGPDRSQARRAPLPEPVGNVWQIDSTVSDIPLREAAEPDSAIERHFRRLNSEALKSLPPTLSEPSEEDHDE
jgi:hypothetical protein